MDMSQTLLLLNTIRKWISRGALFFFLAVSGCATYHPMPITAEAVGAKLQPPDMAQVRILAGEIKHPILHPIELKADEELPPTARPFWRSY